MDIINVYVYCVLGIGLYFNLYKFQIMMRCYETDNHYLIFPWSNQQNVETSTSHPLWLIMHLLTSIFHMCLTGFIVLHPNVKESLLSVLSVSHCAFLLLIIMNVTRLGDVYILNAMIINWLCVVSVSLTYHSEWKHKDIIYFMIITLPVVVETIRYVLK